MATLNFDESIVLILFAQAVGTNPTQADIIAFDAQLQKDFGAKLHQIMTEEGLEIDVHSRSLVLGCRPHVGGQTAPAQIRSACRYVLKARQVLRAATIGGPAAVAPAARELAAGARGRKAASRTTRRRAAKRSRSSKRAKPRTRAAR